MHAFITGDPGRPGLEFEHPFGGGDRAVFLNPILTRIEEPRSARRL